MKEPLEDTLRRLKKERDEADRLYNDALTALDRAVPSAPAIQDPPLPLDEHQLAALNEAWNTLPAPPVASGGLRQRLTAFIWRTVGPYLQRQLTFNSLLVDHINRNVDATKAAHRHAVETAAALRGYADSLSLLHAHLMLYVQQITGYVDTKDRDIAGGTLVLNAALSALAETQAKYRESLAAREHRYEARATALATGHEELRAIVGVVQQAIATLKRHMEGVRGSAGPEVRGSERPEVRGAGDAFAPSLDAYKYVGFENQFRGSEAVIRERQVSYLPYFEEVVGDVLDIGCGRGEFIDLLQGRRIPARGVDLNHEMVALCRSRGLDVVHADAVGYLASQPDDSLGGIFAAQVVEHLEPAYLLRMLDLAFLKLHPGGAMVLETLNPACWTAFFESYIRDITHRWPLHPETLKYLVTASGFSRVEIEFRSPVAPRDRLQAITLPAGVDDVLQEMAETVNANVDALNGRMFSYMDYVVVARKAGSR